MEITIDGKLTKVRNGRTRFSFPAVTILKSGNTYLCYLNAVARKYFDASQGVNWYLNQNYVIAMPSDAINAYRACVKSSKGAARQGYTFPKSLIDDRKVKPGCYKIYKYKDGFAFKPYEPIKED